jgi:hypothetical protein
LDRIQTLIFAGGQIHDDTGCVRAIREALADALYQACRPKMLRAVMQRGAAWAGRPPAA